MSPFQRRLLWASSVLTGITGIVYLWMEHALEPTEPWAVINHPLQPWVLKAHILVAPLMVFAVGLIASDHIWRHFRQRVRAGRRSGIVAMAVLAPMVVTGYLIQAVTHPGWLSAVSWTHVGTGALYLVALVAHHRFFRNGGRRRRRGATAAQGSPRPSGEVAQGEPLVGSPSGSPGTPAR